MYLPLFVGVLCLSLFCYALLCVHFSFAIILKRKRRLVALLLLFCRCIVTINVLWLFLMHLPKPRVLSPLRSLACGDVLHGAVGWSAVCDCSIF